MRISFHVAEWKKSCTPPKMRSRSQQQLPDHPARSERKPHVEGEQDGGEDEDAEALTGTAKSYGF